jgi:hypothetical protein
MPSIVQPVPGEQVRRSLARSRTDGRSHGLYITAEGKTVVAKIRMRIANHEEKFWKDAKVTDRDSILTFFNPLKNQSERAL